MAETATHIPVVWKTTHKIANRLLGETGRPLLERTLALTQHIAAERDWPLKSIKVTHYQDPEVLWEYLLLVLVFDGSQVESENLWVEFLEVMEEAIEDVYQGLNASERVIFANMIDYELYSNP